MSDLDDFHKTILVRHIGWAVDVDGHDANLTKYKKMYEDVVWASRFTRPDTVDQFEVEAYMDSRYKAVRWGAKFVYVDMSRRCPLPLDYTSLKAEYHNTDVELMVKDKDGNWKPKLISNWFGWWSGLSGKKSYDDVAFAPRGVIASHILNLFKNTTVKPIKGDWSKMRSHLFENVCNSNPYRFAYLVSTFASWVQQPDVKNGVCVVLRGTKGVGKSLVFEWLMEIFPHNSGTITNAKDFFDPFTAGTAYQIVTHLEEAMWAGDKQHEGQFKSKVTSPKQSLMFKFGDKAEIEDCHHYVLSTNEQWAVPSGENERRFFVLDVNPQRMQDTEYFGQMVQAQKTRWIGGDVL